MPYAVLTELLVALSLPIQRGPGMRPRTEWKETHHAVTATSRKVTTPAPNLWEVQYCLRSVWERIQQGFFFTKVCSH
jgi:hypothetical protein